MSSSKMAFLTCSLPFKDIVITNVGEADNQNLDNIIF